MDEEAAEEEFEVEAIEPDDEEVDPEFDEELDEDLPEEEDDLVDDEAVVVVEEEEEEEAAVAVVPARRKRVTADEDEEEEEDLDPDDVEADLDTILKDRIAAGDDLDDEEEEEAPNPNDPELAEGVTAKKDGEFTCTGCFMIVHPRQFGRKERLTCPEGYDDCPAMKTVAKMLA